MTAKNDFIETMKNRTKKFAVDIIFFCETLKVSKASSVITYQLVKAATSVGANYRAACRGRSQAEFFSKICIVVEESDESLYWLEVIDEARLSSHQEKLTELANEAREISKIMTKSKDTTYKKLNH